MTNPRLHVQVTYFKRAFAPDDPVQAVRKELDESVIQVLRLVQSLAYVESGKHHKGKKVLLCFVNAVGMIDIRHR